MGEHLLREEAPGVKFGKYTIYRKLAMGGMAELYLARQTGLGNFERTVVLKCILPHLANEEQFVTMFLDEARVASMLNHPNIVQIYEIGEVEGVYYIAMEYIRGPNLKAFRKRLYQRNPRPHYGLLCGVAAQIAAGLHCAHVATDERGTPLEIVHRDVSPTNLLMSYTGAVKLVDFGVAKASIQEHKTRAGMVKGKYRYMSPEQILAKPIDQRSDIYALGAILYELVTNVVVFGRRTEAETIRAVYIDPIMPPSDMVDGFPAELNRIIMRALSRDRNHRYDTAEQMRREMEHFMQSGGRFFGTQEISDVLKGLFAEEVEFERSGLMDSALTRADYIRFASQPSASALSAPHAHTGAYPDSTMPSADPLIPMQRGSGPSQPSHPSGPSQPSHPSGPSHPSQPRRLAPPTSQLRPARPPRGTPTPAMLFPAGIGEAVKIDSQAAASDGETDPTYAIDDDDKTFFSGNQSFDFAAPPGESANNANKGENTTTPTPARPAPTKRLNLWVVLFALLVLGCGVYIVWSWQATKTPAVPPKKQGSAGSFAARVQALDRKLAAGKHIEAVAAMPALQAMARTPDQRAEVKRLSRHIKCAPTIQTAQKYLSAGDTDPARKLLANLAQSCPGMPGVKALQQALANAKQAADPAPARDEADQADAAEPAPPPRRRTRRRRRRRRYRRPRRRKARATPRATPQPKPLPRPQARTPMGQLYVRAPGHARVEINGRLFGFTPINGKALAAGKYRLRVSLAGHTTVSRSILVRPKGPTEITVPLRKLRQPTPPRSQAIPRPTPTQRPAPRYPFSAIRLPRRTTLRVYLSDPRGMIGRSYTSQHRSLCKRIERELRRIMGPRFAVRGITSPWLRYVREKGRKTNRDRFTFYPRAVAYVAYSQLKRGRSRNRVAQIIVNNERRKRWRRYRNR